MYTALAQVYDLFGEDDAAARADYYERFLPRGEGVDIGCGTGALTLELARRGYDIYGVDASADMLNRAATRALQCGRRVRFVLGDAARLPVSHPLDFALAACDVFNYVHRPLAAFRRVYGALKPGGTFAFDISSAYKLRRILAGNAFTQTKEGVTYIWQNYLRGNRLNIEFTVFSPVGETYIKTSETQTQYVHEESDITNALRQAGFANVRSYAFYKKSKPNAQTERILFAAIK